VGFTRMAEAMPPEAVVTMLRQFHDHMTAQIFARVGTVEKYIGDAIFAVFGLPNSSPNDAANALRCANGMLTALERWNGERSTAGEALLAIDIGLHYGPAVIGDVGSEQSISFTVIGDTVNTASRLQALTRTLATPLVVSDAVIAAVLKPPDSAFTVAGGRFCPKQVAIAGERIEIDPATAHRPEAAVAGLISEIGVRVHATGKDALTRHVDDVALVRRTASVYGAREERFDPRDVGVADGVELGDLDHPNPTHLLRGILAADLGELVREPRL
jgi:hypothetical protein